MPHKKAKVLLLVFGGALPPGLFTQQDPRISSRYYRLPRSDRTSVRIPNRKEPAHGFERERRSASGWLLLAKVKVRFMHIPPIQSRREPVRNRFFTHVEEDLIAPGGGNYTYHFIDTTWDAVLIVPVLDDGRLVIERIYRHPYRAWLHEFPAGGIEHGEDPCAAGIRELEEETGYRAARCRSLICYEPVPGLCRMRLHVVLAEGLVQTGVRSHEAMELIEVIEPTRAEAWVLAKQTPTSGFLLNGLLMLEHANKVTGK